MPTLSYELLTDSNPPDEVVGSETNIGSGLTDDVGDPANQNTAHTAEALSHLIEQYQGKPRMEAFVSSFVDQVQDLENALWQLYTERTIDTAVGDQLDGIGAIVGEKRKGRTDDAYRQMIRVRILINRSNGKPEQLYAILVAALGTTFSGAIREKFPASFSVEIYSSIGSLTSFELGLFMRQAKAAGVKFDGLLLGSFLVGHHSITIADAGIIGHHSITVTGADTIGSVS